MTVDQSEDATRQRVRNYNNTQLHALHDTLEFAFSPETEVDKKYIETLRDETERELKRRGLWIG